MWVGPKWEYPYETENSDTEKMTMWRQTEIGVMLLQAKEDLGPPETGWVKEGLERFFLRAFRGSMACLQLDFGLLSARTVGE